MNNRQGLSKAPLFGGYLCVFCGAPADTSDHTPPKCLLEKPYPNDLMTVPACKGCNEGFSSDECFLKVLMAWVSFEDDLIRSKNEGEVARAFERDPVLRAEIEFHTDENGIFWPSNDMLAKAQRVLVKTVKGLYFKHYGHIVQSERVECLAIDHQRNRTCDDVLHEFCDPPAWALYGSGYPEVTPGGGALERFAVACFGEGGDGKMPRWQKPVWIRYQPGVFEYTFRKHAHLDCLVWVLDLHKTLSAAVSCPWPSRSGFGGGLRSQDA